MKANFQGKKGAKNCFKEASFALFGIVHENDLVKK